MPYFITPQICKGCKLDGTEECSGDPDKCKLDAYESHCDDEYEHEIDRMGENR